MGMQEIPNDLYLFTSEGFLRRNPEVAKVLLPDLNYFMRDPQIQTLLGINPDVYRGMDPVVIISTVAHHISQVMDRETYLLHVGRIVGHNIRKVDLTDWGKRMKQDNYGTILLGHEKWIDASK